MSASKMTLFLRSAAPLLEVRGIVIAGRTWLVDAGCVGPFAIVGVVSAALM
jgi:hypothetical protein